MSIRVRLLALAVAVSPLLAVAQTSTPGGIDVEVYFPLNGTNTLCAAPGAVIEAAVFLRPGADQTSCQLACGLAAGGSQNLAIGLIEIEFDVAHLELLEAYVNPAVDSAADALLSLSQPASGVARWALAGNWSPNGSFGGVLEDPCSISPHSQPSWIFGLSFRVLADGPAPIRVRRAADPQPSPLSFAELCGAAVYNEVNGGIDEVIDAVVETSCTGALLFEDDFEGGSTLSWSAVVGG